jgi:rhodanese-related sulfurtransferase
MTRFAWSSLSLNQKLAVIALVLGAVALFARVDRGHRVTVDVKELATTIEKEADHVTVQDLAAWIVEGRSEYRLVDLRPQAEFVAYHIPTAENVALSSLPDFPFERTEKIVLCSEGGVHAYQAWMLMRALGFKAVYTLKGGLDEWKDEVLFPVRAAEATPQEQARFERAAAMARFFGGSPRTAAAGAALAAAELKALPKVEAPPPAAGAAPARRRKKEGC